MKAFIFDLDGVIVSTDSLHYRAWKALADSEGIYFDEEINSPQKFGNYFGKSDPRVYARRKGRDGGEKERYLP